MESINITGEEYERQYFPLGGFLMVAKDLAPKKTGRIIAPESAREAQSKWCPTGIIVKKSLFKIFEDEYEEYLYHLLRKGDRVGYNSTSPIYSPSPVHYIFEGDDKEKYVTIHVKDVICILLDSKEKRMDYKERL